MATPAKKTSKRQTAQPTQPTKKAPKPARSPAKPKIPLAVIRAIIREGLRLTKLRLQYEEDGMDRLIQALREVKPTAKRRKAG